MTQLDQRAQTLLKILIAQHIADGQPVGSRALAQASGLALSSATVRNTMANLEDLGLIASPHTSSGRIPTLRGYRYFVDTLLSVEEGDDSILVQRIAPSLQNHSPQKILAGAAQIVSSLSQFAGIVHTPRRDFAFHHLEFFRVSKKRILLVMVHASGDVQNRLLLTEEDYTVSQLTYAANYLNENYRGLDFEAVESRLRQELSQLQSDIVRFMHIVVDAGKDAMEADEIVIAGEGNLLNVSDFSSNMQVLRELFDLFEQKTQLMRLLENSIQAQGVQIFIGGESDLFPVEAMSVVTAPYHVGGKVVGSLGVIGPTRMAYERMIPLVNVTAKLLSNALSVYEALEE